jgi:hypothetical protein
VVEVAGAGVVVVVEEALVVVEVIRVVENETGALVLLGVTALLLLPSPPEGAPVLGFLLTNYHWGCSRLAAWCP